MKAKTLEYEKNMNKLIKMESINIIIKRISKICGTTFFTFKYIKFSRNIRNKLIRYNF